MPYHTRSISAPAWGNESITPAPAPPLAFLLGSTLHLAPRLPSPSAYCALPGYTDVPSCAESETFALFERQRDCEKEKLRELSAATKFWDHAGKGGNLAKKRRRKEMKIEIGQEAKEKCAGSCCRAWALTPEHRTPRPGALESPLWPGRGILSKSSSTSSSPPPSPSPALLKALPKPA